MLSKTAAILFSFLFSGCLESIIKDKKSGLVTLTNVPANYSDTINLGVSVNSNLALYYKYKVGSSVTTDCLDTTGYSPTIGISNLISENITSLPDGSIKICVLPDINNWNSQYIASAIWIKDTICPNRPFNAGSGTNLDPYLICSTDSLTYISENPSLMSASFKLSADLNMSTIASFRGIGSDATPFTGTFDGNNKTISGLTITTSSTTDSFGFFNALGDGSNIQNLIFTGATVTGGAHSGILAGQGKGNVTLSGISTSGAITVGSYAGGILGRYFYVAGKTLNLSQSTNAATVDAMNSGGVIGLIEGDAVMHHLSNTGNISSTGMAGGIIGSCWGQSGAVCILDLSFSTNSGTISGNADTGGIGGWIAGINAVQMTFKKVVNTGNVTGLGTYVGGIAGRFFGQIEDSYSTGTVSVQLPNGGAGGLIGNTMGPSTKIYRSYSTGNVTDNGGLGVNLSKCGGLIGMTWGVTEIIDSFSTGNVTCSNSSNLVGRFIGSIGGSTVTNCSYVGGSSCSNPAGACGSVAGTSRANVPYFYNSGNAPISNWDNTTIWFFNGGSLPLLR